MLGLDLFFFFLVGFFCVLVVFRLGCMCQVACVFVFVLGCFRSFACLGMF